MEHCGDPHAHPPHSRPCPGTPAEDVASLVERYRRHLATHGCGDLTATEDCVERFVLFMALPKELRTEPW